MWLGSGDFRLDEAAPILSTMRAQPRDWRLPGVIIVLSLVVFLVLAPFATVPLGRMDAFIPAYQSALILCDIITAALLFGQFAITRAAALLALAAGYVFCATMSAAHAATFPGLFAPRGLLGAGLQSTAWLYMFWHGGFPLAAIGYALLKGRTGIRLRPRLAVAGTIVAVLLLTAALTALATAGEALLPPIMTSATHKSESLIIVGLVWGSSAIALLTVLLRRPRMVLDLWLTAVLCAWLCDVALSTVLNAARFDLGFYFGRLFGLIAASGVLILLLLETIGLYTRLARSMAAERVEREHRLVELRAELIHVSRLNELGQMISTLSHEVSQPLAAIGNYARACQRLSRAGNEELARATLDKVMGEATRAGEIIRRLRDFIRKNDTNQHAEDLSGVLGDSIALTLLAVGRRDVAIQQRVHPEAVVALIDKIQVQQVLLNLLRNAVEAMRDAERPSLVLATAPAADGMIEISVADRGPGLSDAVRERLFQPFVTTKSDGMGVGLSICRSIIESHGGRIWAEDNPGGGTVFRFTVPRTPAVAPVPEFAAIAGSGS
jgi:two-component system, sensor histidine kinase and response regulator